MGSVWTDATVVVTGGTGSLGQAFTRYALSELGARTVRVFSRDELKQGEMADALGREGYRVDPADPAAQVRFLVGDVRDADRLELAFRGADVVVHAAALKRVASTGYDPVETVKTNVLGAINVEQAARGAGVRVAVGVSTDKAAAAHNLYGGTKFLMERLFAHAGAYRGAADRPRFCCVRYGNVLGSRGSVVPLWLAAHARGEPLRVADATRFWLTLPVACGAVAQAAEDCAVGEGPGGEVFVPRLPHSTLETMAEAACPGARRVPVPLRPGGEKRHETLVTSHEAAGAEAWDSSPTGAGWILGDNVVPGDAYDDAEAQGWRSDGWHPLDVAGCRALLREAGLLPAPA